MNAFCPPFPSQKLHLNNVAADNARNSSAEVVTLETEADMIPSIDALLSL